MTEGQGQEALLQPLGPGANSWLPPALPEGYAQSHSALWFVLQPPQPWSRVLVLCHSSGVLTSSQPLATKFFHLNLKSILQLFWGKKMHTQSVLPRGP